MFSKILKFFLIIIKFILSIIKHIFLLPLYCSMPDKYSGVTYDEWLKGNDKKKYRNKVK